MSLFGHVTNHVVKGEKTLHACKDLNSAERFSTLCVVERRKSFWFWKQPLIIPTFVTLKDLLLDPDAEFSTKEKEFTLVKNVEDTVKKNMSGNMKVEAKIAKKIAADAKVSLGGEDTLDLNISLGDIIKSEVSFETFWKELENTNIDISHPVLVETALKYPKSSLCVVLGTLSTKDDGQVKKDDKVELDTEVGANLVIINVTAKGSVESMCARSYEIPLGTVLAYECNEIDVDENGFVNVHGVAETFDSSTGVIELPDKLFNKLKEQLEALVKWKNIVDVQEEVKSLLEVGTERDFRVLHVLLFYAGLGGSEKSMKVSKLQYLLGREETQSTSDQEEKHEEEQHQRWKNLLILLGFRIEKYDEEPYIVYPSTNTVVEEVLKSTLRLIDSILDCFSGNWKKVPQLSVQHAHFLMKVIENYFDGKPNSLHQGKLKGLKDDANSMDLLRGCGFKESPGGEDTLDLNISLGDIIKSEVSFETFWKELENTNIDISHPVLVETALKYPKSSLCVVLGTLSTKDDGQVKKDDKVELDTEVGANLVIINVTAKGSVESMCARSYEIPLGTVLAYECNEIDVDENGFVNVHGVAETFDSSTGVIELPDKLFNKLKEQLEALVKWKNIVDVQEEVKSLLEVGTERDFRVLHVLLFYAGLGGSEKSMKVSKLQYLLGREETQSTSDQEEKHEEEQHQRWKNLLILLGFRIEKYDEEPYIVYPSTNTVVEEVLKSTLRLIDSILDCFSGNWKKFPQLSVQHAHFLMKVIENYFDGKPNSLHQGKLKGLKDDANSMDLLRGCGFKESPGGTLTYTGNHRHRLLDVYVVVYVLTVGAACHCSIL